MIDVVPGTTTLFTTAAASGLLALDTTTLATTHYSSTTVFYSVGCASSTLCLAVGKLATNSILLHTFNPSTVVPTTVGTTSLNVCTFGNCDYFRLLKSIGVFFIIENTLLSFRSVTNPSAKFD
jgi:hypothetical protein